MASNPSYPDVPIAPGVPAVLRVAPAPAGSPVNSQQNVDIGAAQGQIGALPNAIGNGFAAANGAISNVRNVGTDTSPNLVNGAFGQSPTLMTADAPGVAKVLASGKNQWGIFDQARNQVLAAHSFKSIAYKHDWRLANYPMQGGAFQSYNKVQEPFEVRVSIVKAGPYKNGSAEVEDLLTKLEKVANSTELYYVVTPQYTYKNVSIDNIDYQRTATQGATMLTIDISLLEVRQAPAAAFTNVKNPSGADAVNGGNVQAVPVTTSATLNSNGTPASSAQFESGVAAPDVSNSAASPSETSTVATSQTPAVAATAPAFDDKPRDSNGNLVTPLSKNSFTGKITTPNGYTQVSPFTGQTMQYDADGNVIKKIDANTIQ